MATAAFTIHLHPVTRFAVDDHALGCWAETVGTADLIAGYIPAPTSEDASRDLARLVWAAKDNNIITADPALELDIHPAGDDDGPGFYVTLHNTTAAPRLIGLTSGFQTLQLRQTATAIQQATEYLNQVCQAANNILDLTR